MKKYFSKITKWVAAGVLTLTGVVWQGANSVMAEGGYGLTVSPMYQNIVINPGDTYEASFRISNPSNSAQDTYYNIEIEPFYMNNKGEVEYTAEGNSGKIADWVTFDIPTEGKLAPNEMKEVTFTINVPESAPAGGQYMSILVTASGAPDSDDPELERSGDDAGAMIKEIKKMAHLVYTEVTGDTVKKGEITNVNLPSFLLSGNITGSATIKNTGNVHGDAKYTLKVFPLFSDEEVYTNEEEPLTSIVMPNRELYSEVAWSNTPAVGIFNVVFTVEFQGEVTEVSKMVIICPIWLLFLIIFVIAAIIIWIVMRVKGRKNSRKKSESKSEEA